MSTRNEFVVVVKGELREAPELIRDRLTELLKLSPEKAAALVARMPGGITKPLPEERALRVVLRLQAAGLAAVHRRAGAPESGDSAAVETEPPPPPAPAAVEPAPAQAEASTPAQAEASTPLPPPAATERPTEAPFEAPTEAPIEAPTEAPFEAPTEAPFEAPTEAPAASDTPWPETAPEPEVRHPTGFDQIPSLDATRIDEPVDLDEPDPKLTPMSEAGFGAADIVLPGEPTWQPGSRAPSIVESGPISRPMPRPPARETPRPDADDADPTMVMPPEAEPGEMRGAASSPSPPRTVRATPAPVARPNGARSDVRAAGTARTARSGDHPAVAPSSRLRDAIARDRGSGERPARDRRPTLTEEDLRLTPPPEVAYRSTKSTAERALTLTPPPEETLRRGGVREDDLASSREQRRGRFGRRLSTMVTLPVTLSWLLSAGFIYLLLPPGLRGELWVPLAAATAIAALSGALAAGLATARTARDVVRLRDDAERIAMGDLSAPVQVRRSDELGDVAASVDRLRVSLQEAMARLRKRR